MTKTDKMFNETYKQLTKTEREEFREWLMNFYEANKNEQILAMKGIMKRRTSK